MEWGVGIQGPSNIPWLKKLFGPILVLEGDRGYLNGLGGSGWLRVMNNGSNWHDSDNWARHCVSLMGEVHRYGCRTLIPLNEANLRDEGAFGTDGRPTLDSGEDGYRQLGDWGNDFIPRLRQYLNDAGMGDVKICWPNLSPFHGELEYGYSYLANSMRQSDIIGTHFYINYPGISWDQGRNIVAQTSDYIHNNLGIWKPMACTEYNAYNVDPGNHNSVWTYCDQVKGWNDYLESLGYGWSFMFLGSHTDPSFHNLDISSMPGALERLCELRGYNCGGQAGPPDDEPPPPGSPCPNGYHQHPVTGLCIPDTTTPPAGGGQSAMATFATAFLGIIAVSAGAYILYDKLMED